MSDSFLPTTTSSNNLPRGLMSKSGLPLNPNQRLPSLRSSLSTPSLLFQASASFNHNLLTLNKNQVKLSNELSVPDCVKQNKNDRRGSSCGKSKKQYIRKTKKLIQLEASVFTGTSSSPVKKVDQEKKLSINKKTQISSLPSTFQGHSEDSIEPAYIEGRLYQDDFIDRSSDDDDGNTEHLPQGWESLDLPIIEQSHDSSSGHWLSGSQGDSFILFQLPKMLENQTNMKLGKLRMYESGKVELVDNPSDLVFEVTKIGQASIKAKTKNTPSNEPDDRDDGRPDIKNSIQDFVVPQMNREVVLYSGRNLICLGKLEPGAAIVLPKILDNS